MVTIVLWGLCGDHNFLHPEWNNFLQLHGNIGYFHYLWKVRVYTFWSLWTLDIFCLRDFHLNLNPFGAVCSRFHCKHLLHVLIGCSLLNSIWLLVPMMGCWCFEMQWKVGTVNRDMTNTWRWCRDDLLQCLEFQKHIPLLNPASACTL